MANGQPQEGGSVAGPSLVSATSLGTYSVAVGVASTIWGVVAQFLSESPLARLVVAALVALAVQAFAAPLQPSWNRGQKSAVWLVVYLGNVAVLFSAMAGSESVAVKAIPGDEVRSP